MDADGAVVERKRLRRAGLQSYLARLPRGYRPVPMSPHSVAPYVKSNKTDVNDVDANAQRRPRCEPRRHREKRPHSTSSTISLNEGRGVNPGDTRRTRAADGCARGALNEGRGVNPGDTRCCRPGPSTARTPLNEGRGVNPGDTSAPQRISVGLLNAQRRPRCEPRRHRTPAGVNPGDTLRLLRKHNSPNPAQRRPRCEPRRHAAFSRTPCLCRSLNEGRGVNPGDTGTDSAGERSNEARSTKAEV